MTALSREDLLALPAVVDVPTVARAYGISERHAYELARQDALPVPVLRLGRLLKVRRRDLLADLLDDAFIDHPSSHSQPAAAGSPPGPAVGL